MNVHDKAYELAHTMKESEEYQNLLSLQNEVEADEESNRMMHDFRDKQMGFQQKMIDGNEPSEDDIKQIEKLYEVIQLHPKISRLFEAEQQFSLLMQDVQRIIAEPLEALYGTDDEDDDEELGEGETSP